MSDIDHNIDDHNVNAPTGSSNGPVRPVVAAHRRDRAGHHPGWRDPWWSRREALPPPCRQSRPRPLTSPNHRITPSPRHGPRVRMGRSRPMNFPAASQNGLSVVITFVPLALLSLLILIVVGAGGGGGPIKPMQARWESSLTKAEEAAPKIQQQATKAPSIAEQAKHAQQKAQDVINHDVAGRRAR
jgi:hypothetical protein